MLISNVERRRATEAIVESANVKLSSRVGRRYEAVMRTTPGRVDKIVIQRHTEDSEQESRAVEKAA